MSLSIGLSTAEGIANGAAPQVQSNPRVIGLAIASQRGTPNVPVLVGSPQQARKLYGGITPGMYGAYVLRNLFNNSGTFGATLYVLRLCGADSVAAQIAAAFTNTNNQAWLVRTLVAPSASQLASSAFYPQFVEVGDSFQLTYASINKAYTAQLASPADVCNGLFALLTADATFNNTYTAVNMGDYLRITSKTVNTALAITNSATNGEVSDPEELGTLVAGQQGVPDPGDWANGMIVTTYPYGVLSAGNVGLTISFGGSVVETYTAKTGDQIVAQLNAQSSYLTIQNFNTGFWPGAVQMYTLVGGVYVAPAGEGDFYPISGSQPSGLACFDGFPVDLIANTEFHTATMTLQGRDYAALNEKHYVGIMPQFANDTTVQQVSQALQSDSSQGSYCSVYNLWVETSDENNGYTWVPALGWILGAGFIREQMLLGGVIWQAPAGVESVLADAIDIAPNNLSQAQIDLYVKTYTTNIAMRQTGTGWFLGSSRTMSTNPLFQSIHIRLFTNQIVLLLLQTYTYLLQKTNSPELRKSVITSITQIFQGWYDAGGLERSVPFETAFQCICDLTNNPVSQDRKELNIDIYWIPSECIEAVGININRNDGVLQVSVTNA